MKCYNYEFRRMKAVVQRDFGPSVGDYVNVLIL